MPMSASGRTSAAIPRLVTFACVPEAVVARTQASWVGEKHKAQLDEAHLIRRASAAAAAAPVW